MTSTLNSSPSMNCSTDISNSSFNSTLFSEVDNPFAWNSKEIARLINIIVRPILVVLGTIGNGLSFFIMRRSSLKNLSTCFYMSILALTDTGKFLTVLKRPEIVIEVKRPKAAIYFMCCGPAIEVLDQIPEE